MWHKLSQLCVIGLMLWGLSAQPAVYAHTGIQIGNYILEYGWLEEPPLAGQPNAIVLNITPRDQAETNWEVFVSDVRVEARYGGQTRVLDLRPLPGGAVGQYIAPLFPSRPGEYTIRLTGTLKGSLGDVVLQNDIIPEEVLPVSDVAFPTVTETTAGPEPLTLGLAIGALVVALIALGLGVFGLVRRK